MCFAHDFGQVVITIVHNHGLAYWPYLSEAR